jgi:PKD repeat protein
VEKYLWSFYLRGHEVNLTGRSTVYKFPAPGVYPVNLTVTDSDGNSAMDSMTVTVVDITEPQASAGESRTFNEGTEVALDGSLSFDNVGIASYEWTISLGGTVIAHRTGEKPRYNFTSPGLYDITLMVTDGVGLQSSDTVQYRVLDVTRPHADAGGDRAVSEDVPETFSAANSTDNVAIIDYNWTIERAGTPRVRKTGISFSYNFTEPGSYTVTLTVKDAAGNWGSSVATVTARDVTRPVSVTPRSIKINIGQTVVLDGRASQDNVGIVRYEWNYTELGVPIEVTGANVTRVFDAAGNYTIRLTVYDAAGNEGTSTFYVDVIKPKAKEKQPGFGALLAVASIGALAALAAGRRRGRE